MQSFFFWKSWIKDYRIIWNLLLVTFIITIGLLWFFQFNGAGNIIHWEKMQEQKIVETSVHTFRTGPFQLNVPAESYIIFEYLQGSDIEPNVFATSCFMIIFALGIVMLLSLITILPRFWYFAAMSLFVVMMMTMRFDVLKLFGFRHIAVSIVIISVYLLMSFYFKYLKTHTSFLIRFASFFLVTLLLAIIIILFARVDYPWMHLMVTAYTPALLLTVIFILLVSHEIMVAFVALTNSSSTGNNPKHFSLISLFYIVNIIITALHEMGVVKWNFLYIDIYLLLIISAILALWGFKIREAQYDNFFPFSPFGAYMVIALGTISFITIAQLAGNGNDAALKVVRDIIIFSHAGFGIIFFIYFVSNFMPMMAQGLPVYHLLYKPTRMPYFTFQLAGLITTLAFIFYSNWREYVYHSTAGFYNNVGDLYKLQDDELFATTFYEQSRGRAFQNHRANYTLANIKTSRLDFQTAAKYYEQSNGKRPTDFSITNEGNLYLYLKDYPGAIKYFNDVQQKGKDLPSVDNNLGYAYAKVHMVDSANYFLSKAIKDDLTSNTAKANFLAMAATEYLPLKADSVYNLFKTDSYAVGANAMALATLLNQNVKIELDPLKNKTLDLYSATYLNNYIIHNAKDLDTVFLHKAYALAVDSLNYPYNEALRSSLSYAYYHQGKVFKALEILGELAFITQDYGGKYNYIMGLWALEQGAPDLAASYFKYADAANYKQGKFYHAIALTEAKNLNYALLAWDSVAAQNDLATQQFANEIIKVLNLSFTQAMQLSDREKYLFCRYKTSLGDSLTFNKIIAGIENPNYKAQALLDRTGALLKADQLLPAIKLFNKIGGLALTDKRLYLDVRFMELRMLAIRKEIRPLAQQINNGIEFDRAHQLDKMLYTALLNEINGENKKAEELYSILATSNPFFEEAILAAADFFQRQDPQSKKTYDILVNAIYVNPKSLRLLKAYAAEAQRQGFDEYMMSAMERIKALEQELF